MFPAVECSVLTMLPISQGTCSMETELSVVMQGCMYILVDHQSDMVDSVE